MSAERHNLPAVVETITPVTTPTLHSALVVPAMIADAGDRASRRFLDFFAASIENDNTRMAYYRAVCSFFAWLDQHGIGELVDIEPFHVAAYLKALKVSDPGDRTVRQRGAAKPTVKQHLASIRMPTPKYSAQKASITGTNPSQMAPWWYRSRPRSRAPRSGAAPTDISATGCKARRQRFPARM